MPGGFGGTAGRQEDGRAAGVMHLAGFLPRRLLATSRPRLAYFPTLTPGLS